MMHSMISAPSFRSSSSWCQVALLPPFEPTPTAWHSKARHVSVHGVITGQCAGSCAVGSPAWRAAVGRRGRSSRAKSRPALQAEPACRPVPTVLRGWFYYGRVPIMHWIQQVIPDNIRSVWSRCPDQSRRLRSVVCQLCCSFCKHSALRGRNCWGSWHLVVIIRT